MAHRTCSIPDCGRAVIARGWCPKHYKRWAAHGDPLAFRPKWDGMSPLERFHTRYLIDDNGCWIWRFSVGADGYGYMSVGGTTKAHRVGYELIVGPIPQGLELDHLCRVRACVNPAHLEPVTHLENMRRGAPATKTHCKRGHEFTPTNTRFRGRWRYCRRCAADASRRYKSRRKAA